MGTRAIQICGTGSGVGKSVIVAGLSRIFLQDGFKVAPFKAQNMSLNSFVTYEGGEIGRAQAMQAAACRLKPSVDMNPILLKPTSDTGSQIILRGKPVGNMSAVEYKNYKDRVKAKVLGCFNRLKKNFEIIVIEGAGSPAEPNLKSHDIVNMKMAEAAGASVILVGDIDRGGVFAWLMGTLELLTRRERKMVKGFIINKFRGDKRLLRSGLDFLEKRTGVKVLGVIPYFKEIKLPEEDSLALEAGAQDARRNRSRAGLIDIAIIKLPHISNFTDFDSLESEDDVSLRYVSYKGELDNADVIIIPGTKNTVADLIWLKKSGWVDKVLSVISHKPSTTLIGICGGYQMLGIKIRDALNIESKRQEIDGFGLLPIVTGFKKEKILAQVKAREVDTNLEVSGYEIHHGRTENQPSGRARGGARRSRIYQDGSRAAFKIIERQGKKSDELDGYVSYGGRIWGTYIHGIFDENAFRRDFINRVRTRKGLHPMTGSSVIDLDRELDKLAEFLRDNIDMDSVYKILSGKV